MQEEMETRGRTSANRDSAKTKHDGNDAGDGDDKNRVTNYEREAVNDRW